MDLTDPTRAVTSSLDGPVLAVLARAGRPLTAGEVAAESARGSEIGVRRTLARLVDQGLVRATAMGRNTVHELNRDHLAAPIAEQLARLRLDLWRRMRKTLSAWNPRPAYACVFGSAARGDGGPDSDIDVLLVRPGVSSEAEWPESAWQIRLDELRAMVQVWTGNPLQVVELGFEEWIERRAGAHELLREVDEQAIVLIDSPRDA